MKERPQLLAFLICENVIMDGDAAIVYRVVDSFNYELRVPGVSEETLGNIPVDLRCYVFTRWGPPGEGEFEEELALINPEGEEVQRGSMVISLPEGSRFAQVQRNVSVGIRTPGEYRWALYLDGELVADLPFMVRITRTATQPAGPHPIL